MSVWRRIFGLELLDNRYPSLHGARVLAILSVVQLHTTWFLEQVGMPLDGWFRGTSMHVFFGMDLFFVLSGFLIGSILLHSLDHMGSPQLRRFYLRRIFRTFPSYWVVLTFLALFFGMTDTQRAHLPYEYVYATNFLELGRTSVVMPWAWSLALEEQFYLLVPLLFLLLWKLRSDRARAVALALLWLSGTMVRLGYYVFGSPWGDRELYEALYFRSHTRYDTLLAGVLLAVVHRAWGPRIGEWLKTPGHRAFILLPSAGLAWICINPALLGDDLAQLMRVFAWGTFTSVFLFGIVNLLLHGEGRFHRFLSAPVFRRIATVGYGVYLVHIPIIQHYAVPFAADYQRAHGTSMWLLWPLTLGAVMLGSMLVAYGLHVVVEKPSLRIRERLAA